MAEALIEVAAQRESVGQSSFARLDDRGRAVDDLQLGEDP
jgi:hypothetical protein